MAEYKKQAQTAPKQNVQSAQAPVVRAKIERFISGLMGSVPPLQDLFKMAGMSLPEYMKGKEVPEDQGTGKKEVK